MMMLIERAEDQASHMSQDKIMPSDIRYVVLMNSPLRDRLGFSSVYWNGRQ